MADNKIFSQSDGRQRQERFEGLPFVLTGQEILFIWSAVMNRCPCAASLAAAAGVDRCPGPCSTLDIVLNTTCVNLTAN